MNDFSTVKMKASYLCSYLCIKKVFVGIQSFELKTNMEKNLNFGCRDNGKREFCVIEHMWLARWGEKVQKLFCTPYDFYKH